NFDADGNLIGNPSTFLIDEVDTDTDYAILVSTCSGAWRYMIGDVLRFTNVKESEIQLVGRTKQFLSICGEHTSIDNLNTAIESVIKHFTIKRCGYSVAGYRIDSTFAHHWFIATDNEQVDVAAIRKTIDQKLRAVNDDYAVERDS